MVAHLMLEDPQRRARLLAWGGGALALVVAAFLFAQFGLQGNLSRDEAIYSYGGQQLADGVPVYQGIFDPKPPLPTYLTAIGALAGRAIGKDDLVMMRAEFFVFALLAVGAVYLLGLRLWRSPLAALVGAVAFASFKGFAADALSGPDAKTPGVLLSVLAMVLLVERRWFWGAFAGALAFLDWQPLGIYMLAAVAAAVLAGEPRWRQGARALAGAAIPLAATVLYLAIDGALSQFIEASFTFPATGLKRGHETFGDRIDTITHVVNHSYHPTRVLFWAGLVLLPAVLAVGLVKRRDDRTGALVVLLTLLGFVAVTLTDFQGYPDLFPLLPYAALGCAGAVALVAGWIGRERLPVLRVAAGATAAAMVAVVWISAERNQHGPPAGPKLSLQRKYASSVNRLLGPGERLYALGDPTLLVLTGRRNPTRYIYLGSGVDQWGIKHEFGSLAGWQAEIRAVDPPVIVMNTWVSLRAQMMAAWLKQTYGPAKMVGKSRFYVKPSLRARAAREGI
jgi:MFS family permease